VAVSAVLSVAVLSSCVAEKQLDGEALKSATVGVVETSDSNYTSTLHFLDDNLETVATKSLSEAGLGETFHKVSRTGEDVFLTVRGADKKLDGNKVLSASLGTGEIRSYDTGLYGANGSLSNGKYVFSHNCLTAVNVNLNFPQFR
jgi:hypothetical protein